MTEGSYDILNFVDNLLPDLHAKKTGNYTEDISRFQKKNCRKMEYCEYSTKRHILQIGKQIQSITKFPIINENPTARVLVEYILF